MSEKNVLLIDDSATIRRLVDSELAAAGFRVLLAPTAEEGLQKAADENPDLIILDHQLPGTTGYEVCCQLLANPATASIPVVASSTLRKKAYSEYVDCDNVVDMLPKPYTAEVLIATVENAIDTAAMVVQSQSDGSAVPEVIDELGDSDLAGTFECFSLREVIDLLNNGRKSGALEITTRTSRFSVFTADGRIQAITASGIDPEVVVSRMPENLADLAPVIKFTVSGKKGSEVDGMVELLDNKVLDPRMLRRLLRIQAATLLKLCFDQQALSFRFDSGRSSPSLFAKLPLDISLVALLVEASQSELDEESGSYDPESGFVRKAIRGQSLDRAGLSSRHMQLMKIVSKPKTIATIAQQLDWTENEAWRVLQAFEQADLIERTTIEKQTVVYCSSENQELRDRVAAALEDQPHVKFTAVSDILALGLLVRRQSPDAVVVDLSNPSFAEKFRSLKQSRQQQFVGAKAIAVVADVAGANHEEIASLGFDDVIAADFCAEQLMASLLGGVADQKEEKPVLNSAVAAPSDVASPPAVELVSEQFMSQPSASPGSEMTVPNIGG